MERNCDADRCARAAADRAAGARRALSAFLLAGLTFAAPAAGQEAMPAPDAADVGSLDAIVAAVYDVISGPIGEARDWDRFKSLFVPEARLIATGRDQSGQARYRVMTPSQYVEANGSSLTSVGFMEKEIARRVETFGAVTHAFSTYESAYTQNGQPASARGINSIQLFNDGSRWWIITIYWDSERPDNPIPAKYLPGGGR